MASASSSIVASGSSRVGVSRHASLQPVSSLRIKPFSNAKTSKSRPHGVTVGIRNSRNPSSGRQSWPVYAAETDAPAEGEEVVDEADVQYDIEAEEDEFGEAEAVVELSEEQLADSGFMGRQLSKFSDEAVGTVATTAEEDAAAQEREEGIQQIIQTIMDIEKLTSTDVDVDAEEGDEAEESPIPFSDEAFYDEVYKNIKEIEAFSTDTTDFTDKNELDYSLVNAVAAVGPDPIGAYPSALDEQLAKYEITVDELTGEEQQVVDLASATTSVEIPVPPRGVNELLSVVNYQPLTAEEQQLLDSAQPGELDQSLKEEVEAYLAVSMQAAGVPSKIDLTSSALFVMGKLADAAKDMDGAALAARGKAILAKAKADGSVSDAELAVLTAAADSLATESFALPEGLYKALGEKLDEVQTTGLLSDEADDSDAGALEAEIASLLASSGLDVSQFSGLESKIAGLKVPEGPSSAAAQFLESAKALLGADQYQQLVTEAIGAASDPAQVAAAKQFFLSEAQSVLSGAQFATVSANLADLGFADVADPQVPTVNVPSIDEFLNAPEVDEAVSKAVKEAVAATGSAKPVIDASLYVTDKSSPVYVEYETLKAELKEVAEIDLDDYKPQEEVVDERMLSIVALMLKNAAEGKPLAEGVDKLELPQESAEPEEPLSAELEAVRAQLDAVWENVDVSYTSPGATVVDEADLEADDLTVEDADEAEELSPEAGIMQLESDSPAPARALAAEVDSDVEIGEIETAEEAKWVEVTEEEWEATAKDVFLGDEDLEDADPEAALARAEAALERFAAKEGFDESDVEVLKEIVNNLADVQVACDPRMQKVNRASLLVKAVRDHATVVERALSANGRVPSILVPENMTKEQAGQFVQAYGGRIEEAVKAAAERAKRGIYVRSLADAIADVSAPAAALDADSLEAEFRALATNTLTPEEIADIEANTPDNLVSEDTIVEVTAEEYEEQLKEQFTESEILDFKARGYAMANPLAIDTSSITKPITTEAQIDGLLASMGVAPEPEPELAEIAEAEVVDVEAVAEEAVAETADSEEVDEMSLAFKELLDEIIEEVRDSADDAEYVEDATVYEAAAEGDDGAEAEEEVEEGWEFDEDEAQALLDDVLAGFSAEGTEAVDADDVDAMGDAMAAAGGDEDEADDDGEAELQTIYNTSPSELLAQDYDDVWDSMGIPEARPKVPSKPRAQEKGAEETEEAEFDGYEEEEELVADDEAGEEDVADAIAQYYKADELDGDEDVRAASLSAPKTTLDLFGSSPYLEDDGDRAADDTQGLLERVTVSKTGDIFVERIIQVNRVTKVVKGGKIMSFRCVAIVGNRNGIVGVGVGSAREVVQAVTKACQDAKSNLIAVPLTKFDSIPHRVETKFKASIAILNPAADGTGCIAGGAVRSVLELAGVKNCLAKRLGSRNPLNNARATIKALEQLQTWGEVAGKRGVPIEYLFAKDEGSAAKALSGSD